MKEIIEKLKQNGTVFTINGITNWKDEPKPFRVVVTEFANCSPICSIDEIAGLMSRSMNVKKFTATCIHLYDYNLFGQKSTFKIKYSDVTIVEE
jgi:hypothetical protein